MRDGMTTGEVEGIAAGFKSACTATRIPLRHRFMYWFSYIRLARRGVQEHSPTHDTQYQDGPLRRRYDRWCERINRRLAEGPAQEEVAPPTFTADQIDTPQLRRLMDHNIPFVIKGGADHLPVRNWTLDYIDRVAGDCDVPINCAADLPSPDLTRPTKAHHYYQFRTGKLSEVVASIRDGGNLRISTAEDVMHYGGGQLRDDLQLPYWEEVTGWTENQRRPVRSRFRIGQVFGAQLMLQPENAFTIWHAEPGDNFFVLAKGAKTWWMAHPYYTAAMRPRVKSTTNYHGCNIDVREPEDALRRRGFDGYLTIPKVRVDLHAGDVIRVPNHWWHTVVTHPGHYTIAATIRANNMPNRVGPGYTILRWLDRKYWTMATAFERDGRIYDRNIGYPRPPRAEEPEGAATN